LKAPGRYPAISKYERDLGRSSIVKRFTSNKHGGGRVGGSEGHCQTKKTVCIRGGNWDGGKKWKNVLRSADKNLVTFKREGPTDRSHCGSEREEPLGDAFLHNGPRRGDN